MPVHDVADCRAQNCHHHPGPLVPRDIPAPVNAPDWPPSGFCPPSDPTRRSED